MEDLPTDALENDEKESIERSYEFRKSGHGYAMMHGTRPSTIGHVLASSPLALLAW